MAAVYKPMEITRKSFEKVRKAYDKKRLGAQNETYRTLGCSYLYDDSKTVCGIGAMCTPTVFAKLEELHQMSEIIQVLLDEEKIFSIPGKGAKKILRRKELLFQLQNTHDNWATTAPMARRSREMKRSF